MSWALAITAGWILLAVVAALVVGRGIRLADRKAAQSAVDAANVTADQVLEPAAGRAAAAAPGRGPTPAYPPATRGGPNARAAIVLQRVPATEQSAAGRDTGRR
jgi:hypothetical protein